MELRPTIIYDVQHHKSGHLKTYLVILQSTSRYLKIHKISYSEYREYDVTGI